jgi:RNA polymerase sigma-70 factor (ECF subfamily)
MTADSANGRAGWATSTSRSLLSAARDDEADAWRRLVHLYAPLAAAWCRRSGVAPQDIADVLQEVFAAVARNLDRFRKDRPADTFRGWLATITRNKVRDYYRRRGEEPAAAGGTEAAARLAQILDPLAADSEEVAADAAALGGVLQRALAAIRGEFHERTWQAFWEVVVEGRPAAEVGADLQMQPGHVRVAKSRILHRLRQELGDHQA